jgi:hypothetical protein
LAVEGVTTSEQNITDINPLILSHRGVTSEWFGHHRTADSKGQKNEAK